MSAEDWLRAEAYARLSVFVCLGQIRGLENRRKKRRATRRLGKNSLRFRGKMDVQDLEMVWIWTFVAPCAACRGFEDALLTISYEWGSGLGGKAVRPRRWPQANRAEIWIGGSREETGTRRWEEEMKREKRLSQSSIEPPLQLKGSMKKWNPRDILRCLHKWKRFWTRAFQKLFAGSSMRAILRPCLMIR